MRGLQSSMASPTRPTGISSRVTRLAGSPGKPWKVREGIVVDLPVVVDWVCVDATGREETRVEATVDLVDGVPRVVGVQLTAATGLNLGALQREFRWASPLEVVTGLMPHLLETGIDPFTVDLPLTGFPAVAARPERRPAKLSDEFLTTIAREYTVRGRGYATSLAREYFVSPRTVVSWVEKARARGLLTPPPSRGSVGGDITRGH